jgi:flavodoxin
LFNSFFVVLPETEFTMKKCAYCGGPIIGKQKTAKFCSDICRLRAYRVRHGIEEPFEPKKGKKQPENDFLETSPKIKSYTCCENACFYSPVARWGELLICDNCGAVWQRLGKDPRMKNQDNQELEEND